MEDMLKRDYGNKYPSYCINPFGGQETKESTIIYYDIDFPTAQEMRESKDKLTPADWIVIKEIKSMLEASTNRSSISYEGDVSHAVERFLGEKGYGIKRDRQYNIEYVTISW